MRRVFVCLLAFIMPMLLMAETFKITIDRQAHVGTTALKPGDYKVTVDGSKAEFEKGKEKVMADVKQQPLDAKARQGYVRYGDGADNRITEIVVRGGMVRWLFP